MVNKINSLSINKNLIILFDDLNTGVGYLMGSGTSVSGESINLMTIEGKGLVYVCISEEKANKLKLSNMEEFGSEKNKKFTVSVDYKTTTTGISAFERADTIKAFTNERTQPNDFNCPGHIFPLVSNLNVFNDPGIAEIACTLLQLKSHTPVAYVCEILNDKGEIASKKEIDILREKLNLQIIYYSDIVECQYEETDWLKVINSQQINNVNVHTIKETLFNQEFKIYTRTDKEYSNKVSFYKECESGDIIGLKDCKCRNHFKDYYKNLIDNRIDAVVVNQNKYSPQLLHSFNYPVKSKLIFRQINSLIESFYKSNNYTIRRGTDAM